MQLAEALLQALGRAGAREIFGIPGDFALPLFEVIERSAELPLYTLSHEPAVGFAADAAARFGGGLGVAAVTYGAGAFNMVNPIAGAYAEKSPVVVISGSSGRRRSGRAGCCCTTRPGRSTRSSTSTARSPATRPAGRSRHGARPIARVLRRAA